MDIQNLMQLFAQQGKRFVPYEEAQRRRQMEFDIRFPNAKPGDAYSVNLDGIFGPNERVETYDEYLRRTGQGSHYDRMRDVQGGGNFPGAAPRMPQMQNQTDRDKLIALQRMLQGQAPQAMPNIPGLLQLLGGNR